MIKGTIKDGHIIDTRIEGTVVDLANDVVGLVECIYRQMKGDSEDCAEAFKEMIQEALGKDGMVWAKNMGIAEGEFTKAVLDMIKEKWKE